MKFFVNLNVTFDDDYEEERELREKLQEVVGEMAMKNVYFSYKFDEHVPIEERRPARHSDYVAPQK